MNGGRAAAGRGPRWWRWLLIGGAVGFLGLFLVLPLAAVFSQALAKGWAVCLASCRDPDAAHAIGLTLGVAAITVPVNTVFGILLAWAATKFHFRGRSLLLTVLDLPFSISPVIAGLLFTLLFGRLGWWGPWLQAHGCPVIFALPGVILVSLFVTCPFVARELIPLMQEQGQEEEEAALSLGAGGGQIFWRVTLPNVRWALLYGVILTNARVMGEFGAVSVVSGQIRGETCTLPLQVEILYNEYDFAAAFSLASLLALLALLTLAAKSLLEWGRE